MASTSAHGSSSVWSTALCLRSYVSSIEELKSGDLMGSDRARVVNILDVFFEMEEEEAVV